MLALYLHHDSSVLTNVFCTQVLCADPVIGMYIVQYTLYSLVNSEKFSVQFSVQCADPAIGMISVQFNVQFTTL